jgi:lysophospholipase L1-like esterase
VRRRSLSTLVATGALALAIAGVGVVSAAGTGSAATQPGHKFKPYYVSLGDSYSVGYQNSTLGNTSGFTGYVAKKEHLQLENFGCGGATTTSLFTQISCPPGGGAATDGVPYPTTNQVDAALAFIAAHPGEVALVTVSISGNDVTSCAAGSNPIPCVLAASSTIATNVGNLVHQLDTALTAYGDTTAHIVGITYPDVILGDYVAPVGATNPTLAALSVVAFDALINPTLNTAYTSVARGAFVNVTSAPYKLATAGDDTGTFNTSTGAYTGPTTNLRGVSKTTPVAVAEVCTLTWYCNPATFGDIHANTKGYNFIGGLIVAKLATL